MKVLIIKLGWSETLDPEVGKYPSLGDVVRTTPILHSFIDDDVTWLTDERAYPLLKDNPLIYRVLFFDLATVLQLQAEQFDVVINLEKGPGLCALTNSINAYNKYGFRLDPITGEVSAFIGSGDALEIYSDHAKKRESRLVWQDVLFEMIGRTWTGETYVLGYRPKSNVKYDVGLNFMVGSKWKNKEWPKQNWNDLWDALRLSGYTVSNQDGSDDLEKYMDWINSCKLIVTHDSLGLHLAIALGKKVIALFGGTPAHEVYLYEHGKKIVPEGFRCLPCLVPECRNEVYCMSTITVDRVLSEIRGEINASGNAGGNIYRSVFNVPV
ncbi:MAG: glycosyltransferase family 9 protein [Magnetococcus sp. WYHC-3]